MGINIFGKDQGEDDTLKGARNHDEALPSNTPVESSFPTDSDGGGISSGATDEPQDNTESFRKNAGSGQSGGGYAVAACTAPGRVWSGGEEGRRRHDLALVRQRSCFLVFAPVDLREALLCFFSARLALLSLEEEKREVEGGREWLIL